MRRYLQWIILGSLGVLVFLSFLGRCDIVTSHEARVAQTAREMATTGWPWNATPTQVPGVALVDAPNGLRLAAQPDKPPLSLNSWGVPVLNGQIRLQKPPLPYWATALTYRLIGISEGAARLTPALLGALCIPLLHNLARHLIGRRAAWIAALLWVSSYFIPDEFRKSMADPYLAFFTLLCFWAWVRAAQHPASPAWPILLFYVGAAFGILTKGPVLLVHLAAAIPAFHLCFHRPVPRRWTAHLAGLFLLLAIAIPWPLYVIRHVPNALVLWRYESFGELTGENIEKAREWFFYLPSPFQLSLPWIALWLVALVYPFVRKRTPRLRLRAFFPLIWCAGTVLIFSFSAAKKNAYLLPMMPALVLLITQAVVALLAISRCSDKKWPWIAVEVQKVIGLGWGIALATVLLLDIANWPLDGLKFRAILGLSRSSLGQITLASTALALLALAAGIAPLLFDTRRQLRAWFAAQATSYALLLLLMCVGWDIPRTNARSPKHLLSNVALAAAQPGYTLAQARMQEAAMFYLPLGLRYDPAAQHVLVIVEIRPKYRPNTQDPQYFKPDIPDATPIAVRELPIKTTSPRNGWRLFDVTVHRN